MGGLLTSVVGLVLTFAGLALAVLFVGTVIMAPYTVVVLWPIWWAGRRFWRHLHAEHPAAPAPAQQPLRSSMEWEEDL